MTLFGGALIVTGALVLLVYVRWSRAGDVDDRRPRPTRGVQAQAGPRSRSQARRSPDAARRDGPARGEQHDLVRLPRGRPTTAPDRTPSPSPTRTPRPEPDPIDIPDWLKADQASRARRTRPSPRPRAT